MAKRGLYIATPERNGAGLTKKTIMGKAKIVTMPIGTCKSIQPDLRWIIEVKMGRQLKFFFRGYHPVTVFY